MPICIQNLFNNMPTTVQCKEVCECLPQACFIYEQFSAKVVVQAMKDVVICCCKVQREGWMAQCLSKSRSMIWRKNTHLRISIAGTFFVAICTCFNCCKYRFVVMVWPGGNNSWCTTCRLVRQILIMIYVDVEVTLWSDGQGPMVKTNFWQAWECHSGLSFRH